MLSPLAVLVVPHEVAAGDQRTDQGLVGAVSAELVQDGEPVAGAAHELKVRPVLDEAAGSLPGLSVLEVAVFTNSPVSKTWTRLISWSASSDSRCRLL